MKHLPPFAASDNRALDHAMLRADSGSAQSRSRKIDARTVPTSILTMPCCVQAGDQDSPGVSHMSSVNLDALKE